VTPLILLTSLGICTAGENIEQGGSRGVRRAGEEADFTADRAEPRTVYAQTGTFIKFIIQLQSMGDMNLKNKTPRMHHITPFLDEKFINFLERGTAPPQTTLPLPLTAPRFSRLRHSTCDPPQCSSGVDAHAPSVRVLVLSSLPIFISPGFNYSQAYAGCNPINSSRRVDIKIYDIKKLLAFNISRSKC